MKQQKYRPDHPQPVEQVVFIGSGDFADQAGYDMRQARLIPGMGMLIGKKTGQGSGILRQYQKIIPFITEKGQGACGIQAETDENSYQEEANGKRSVDVRHVPV